MSARNFLAAIFSAVFLMVFLIVPGAGYCDDAPSNPGQAIVEKFNEWSQPLFNPDGDDNKNKVHMDPFYKKLNRKRDKFFKDDRERKRKFFEKLREKDLTTDEQREKISKFNKNEIERMEKFIRKQQKKIDKHQEK